MGIKLTSCRFNYKYLKLYSYEKSTPLKKRVYLTYVESTLIAGQATWKGVLEVGFHIEFISDYHP